MDRRPQTVVAALASALAADPGRPLLTFYDATTGERVELSVATVNNWVNKIANLLGEELMLSTGDLLSIDLPPHWQASVTIVGAWTAGLALDQSSVSEAMVRVVGPAALPGNRQAPGASTRPRPAAAHVLACSLRPLAGRFIEPLPDGWLDFALEVPAQPDLLVSAQSPGSDDVALSADGRTTSHGQLAERGSATAKAIGLSGGGRLLTDLNPATEGLVTSLVAPLVTGSSVVLVANAHNDVRDSIAAQERVTAIAWAGGS